MKLQLSEWAHVAEIVGAAAVVASLVFVGFQLRENTREVRAGTFQAVADTDLALLQELARSKELATSWRYYLDYPESLDQPELFQATDMATAMLRNLENIHAQSNILPERWASQYAVMQDLLRTKGLMCFFATSLNARAFIGPFREEVIDPILADSPFVGHESECPSLVRTLPRVRE